MFRFPGRRQVLSFDLRFRYLLTTVVLRDRSFHVRVGQLYFLLVGHGCDRDAFLRRAQGFSLTFASCWDLDDLVVLRQCRNMRALFVIVVRPLVFM